MDIVNFFEKVEGTWFSQRTTHFSPGLPSKTGQSMLEIKRLASDTAQCTSLCQHFEADKTGITFAISAQQMSQAGTYGANASATPQHTTTFIGVKGETAASGRFFSQTDQTPPTHGRYRLEDEVLILTLQTDALQSEERWWFMNPNLRMRTSVLKGSDGFQMASFCSEVRRLQVSKPPA